MSDSMSSRVNQCASARWFFLALTIASPLTAFAAAPEARSFTAESCKALVGDAPLVWRLDGLKAARDAVGRSGDPMMAAQRKLIKAADAALGKGPYSVVDKTKPSPSGDPHDYVSIGPYWWPDPESKDGLPYIRRDGLVNPERDGDEFDRVRLSAMAGDVRQLALAAYFSGDQRYSKHAEKLLRVWFVDPKTRMNPSLAYAQAVPGKSKGRGIGIIDTFELADVVDAALLLKTQGMLSDEVFTALRGWFGAYARWLDTHENGIEERAAKNNHGTFYDMQYMLFSLFAQDCNAALRSIIRARGRIDTQITASGEMPLESSRSKSLHYHVFNLEAFLMIARMGEHFGLDLYSYKGKQGGGIVQTLGMLAGYAGREDQWPHEQIKDDSAVYLWKMLSRALTTFDDAALVRAEKKATGRKPDDETVLLQFIAPEPAQQPEAPPVN